MKLDFIEDQEILIKKNENLLVNYKILGSFYLSENTV